MLHADMLGETRKVDEAADFAADGDSALKAACRDGDEAAAAQLLERGADADARAAALVVACARRRGALLAALPALGAGLGAAGKAAWAWEQGWKRAASNDAPLEVEAAVVEALLPLAAELLPEGGVDVAGAGGRTALWGAADGGHALAVDRLLAAGAAVDRAANGGFTPLSMAAQNGHDAVVARLLAGGAAVDLARDGGATPLFQAAQNGHDAVVARLLAADAKNCPHKK